MTDSILDVGQPTGRADAPVVRGRSVQRLSPWVEVVAREIGFGPDRRETFHSLRQNDYVNVLAVTESRAVVLVQQFRPAWESETLELPGGLLETNEDPAECASRELAEETGFVPVRPLIELGCLKCDTGRLENRLWCFAALEIQPLPGWRPEGGIARRLVPMAEFRAMVLDNEFDHALHVAVLGLALLRNVI